jgi:hypothetical protein
LNLREAQDRIAMLKSKLSHFLLQMSAVDLTQSPAQGGFLDIVKNPIAGVG